MIIDKIKEHFEHKDITNTILTLRLFGTLESGKTSDINFKKMKEQLEFQGAICILQNTTKLQSTEFSEIKISSMDPNNIEEHTINEHIGQLSLFEKDKELHLIKNLITSLNTTKQQGEKVADFEKRIFEDLDIALENT